MVKIYIKRVLIIMKVSGCKFIKIIPNAQNQTDIHDKIKYYETVPDATTRKCGGGPLSP